MDTNPLEQQQPDGSHQWTCPHEQTRAKAIRESPEAPGEREHDNRRGQSRKAALERRVAADLLQEDRQEEEQDRQTRIHRERLEISRREVALAKELERQHRIARPRLVQDKANEQYDPADERHDDARACPAEPGLLDQRKHWPT